MAHFGTAVLIDRIVKLFGQELNAELALVDAAANARAAEATPEYSFTTDPLPADAIRGFFDSELGLDESVTVLEGDRGRSYVHELKQDAREGLPTNRPRLGIEHDIAILVRCVSRKGTWGVAGAYRRADRIATAAVVLLGRFPILSVPAPANLAGICHKVARVHSDQRPSHVEAQDKLTWTRVIGATVTTLEDRQP